MKNGISNIYSKPIRYWVVAILSNTASMAALLYIGGFLLDIVSYYIGSEILSGYAYGIALISMLLIFWIGGLAVMLRLFVKCDHCGNRVITFNRSCRTTSDTSPSFKFSKLFPFVVPLTYFCCDQCNVEFKVKMK